MQALGLIETRGLLAAVESADAMLKAAEVTLLEKTYVGGGLVTIIVTGGVAAVKAAVEAGCSAVKQISDTMLISQHVIPRPHEEITDLIVPAKHFENEEIQNIQSVEVDSIEEAETTEEAVISEEAEVSDNIENTDIVVEDKTANSYEDEKAAVATEEVVVTGATTINEYPEKIENSSLNVGLDEINKESIDKLVLENGLEKAIQVLSKLKVTKLRKLARKYVSMGIKGRIISKADKNMLLAEFKEYYRNKQ